MRGRRRSESASKASIFGPIRRFRVVWLLTLGFFAIVMLRLADLQVVNARIYQEKAQRSHAMNHVFFNRGRILDRNGVILAQDTVLYDVFVHPRYFYKDDPAQIAQELAEILDMPVSEIMGKFKLGYETIAIKKNVPKSVAHKVKALKYQCLDTPRKMVRRYPQGHLASHLVGYVNDDASISTGIEYSAEKILRTPPKLANVDLDAHGNFVNVDKMPSDVLVKLPEADDATLTIDARIQYAAEAALAEGLKTHKAKRGATIVMNPKTGEILAFAVLPDFDPEHYAKAQPQTLKNWAITDVYPPGSTFKILTLACGLETGVINRNSRLHDTGQIQMNGFTIKNYDYSEHGAPGDINLIYLLQHSSNIGSLKISLMMDPVEHHRLVDRFGIGSKTRIDIPGESAGILHSPKQWDPLTHATIGFGYGMASTPIQMAAAVGAIANKGVWVTPHLLQNQTKITRRRVISEQTASTLTDLLAEAIDTAKNSTVRLDEYRVAGKTGTSRKPVENGRGYSSELFTSFVGYFPAEDPEVLIMVVVDNPTMGNAWGSTVAGPIFKKLALQTAGYLGMEPAIKPASKSLKKP